MVEAAGVKCSLLAKKLGPLGCQRVLSELAQERGRSLDEIPAAFRNRRVADACPASCGLCQSEFTAKTIRLSLLFFQAVRRDVLVGS